MRIGSAARCSLVIALATVGGCSLTTTDVQDCQSSLECREAFGAAYSCAANGLCEVAAPYRRCDRTFPDDLLSNPSAYTDAIVLGSMQDLALETKRARERSAVLAMRQANREGGLDGRPFAMILCTVEENDELDSLTSGEAARAVARHLVDVYGVPAIVGPSSSPNTQEAFQELRGTGTLVFSPSASSPALTTLESEIPGLLWRAAPPDTLQAGAIASDMREPGAERLSVTDTVDIIHETGAYGDGLANVFHTEFLGLGGSATLHPFSNSNQRDVALAQAATGSADEVLFIAQTADVIALVNGASALAGFDSKRIFVSDTAAAGDFVQNANDKHFGALRGARPKPLDEGSDLGYAAFLASYSAEYGNSAASHSFTAHSYDAGWLVMYGAAWSFFQEGAVTGSGIAQGLTRVSDGPTVTLTAVGWNSAISRFREGNGIDVSGASGELDYDPATEELGGIVQIFVIENREIRGVDLWSSSN